MATGGEAEEEARAARRSEIEASVAEAKRKQADQAVEAAAAAAAATGGFTPLSKQQVVENARASSSTRAHAACIAPAVRVPCARRAVQRTCSTAAVPQLLSALAVQRRRLIGRYVSDPTVTSGRDHRGRGMIAHVPINAPQVVEKLDSVPVFTVTTSRARVNNTAGGLGANAAQAADWPRLAGARGSPEHGLALAERGLRRARWSRSAPARVSRRLDKPVLTLTTHLSPFTLTFHPNPNPSQARQATHARANPNPDPNPDPNPNPSQARQATRARARRG